MQRSHPLQRASATVSTRQVARAAALALALATPVLLLAALRYPSLFEPQWYGDEGIFAGIAHNMLEGRALYAEAWDNKPPMIFLTYAAVQAAFGTGAGPLHAASMAAALATQVALMAIAARLYGAWRASVAGLVLALAIGTPLLEGNLALTESFMILPSTLAVLLCVVAAERDEPARLPWHAAAGVLLGIAASYKQVALFDAAAVAFMLLLLSERPLRAVVPLAAGFGAVHVAFIAVFAFTGAVDEYIYAVAGSLRLYSAIGDGPGPFLSAASAVPAALAAWRAIELRRDGRLTWQAFAPVWLGFTLVAAVVSPFAFPHYLLQAAPPFALAVASLSLPAPRDRISAPALAVVPAACIALALGVSATRFWDDNSDRRQLRPVPYYRTFLSHEYGTMSDIDRELWFDGKVIAVRDIVGAIERDGRGDTVFAWSELPWLYAAGELRNPTRYYASFLPEFVPGARDEIMRDLAADPPVYIVISDRAYAPFEDLERFVTARYEQIQAQNDWRLYRLAD